MTRKETAYAFIDNVRADISTNAMVRKSKKSNRELKKGNFQKAEMIRRNSEMHKNRALEHGKYNREKLIKTALKAHDGEEIRHETKVKSIEKLK